MGKMISIIVPVYNVEKYICKCLDSITKQSYKNLQIIVVDDGSTDDSGKICDEYLQKDSRIQVVHKENGGLSDARNVGMKLAEGEYIGFVDGDDYIEIEMYERLYELCEDLGADIAVANIRQIYSDFIVELPKYNRFQCSGLEAVRRHLSGDGQYHLVNAVWNKLYRRTLLNGLEFPKGRNYEDICYTVAVLLKCKSVACAGETLYNYFVEREGSIMNHGIKENHALDAVLNCEDRTEILKVNGIKELLLLGYDNYLNQVLLSFHRIWNSEFIYDKSSYVEDLCRRLNKMYTELSEDRLRYKARVVYLALTVVPGVVNKIIGIKLCKIRKDAKKNGHSQNNGWIREPDVPRSAL